MREREATDHGVGTTKAGRVPGGFVASPNSAIAEEILPNVSKSNSHDPEISVHEEDHWPVDESTQDRVAQSRSAGGGGAKRGVFRGASLHSLKALSLLRIC